MMKGEFKHIVVLNEDTIVHPWPRISDNTDLA